MTAYPENVRSVIEAMWNKYESSGNDPKYRFVKVGVEAIDLRFLLAFTISEPENS
jgi:hypothetical protein